MLQAYRMFHLDIKKDYIPLYRVIIIPIMININKKIIRMFKMIIFNKLWALMEARGITSYRLREECGIDRKTIRRLKLNENVETKTINKLCNALNCSVEDIMEFVPDKK